jgi:anaerobic selenocysteine-containing dehydrogenase
MAVKSGTQIVKTICNMCMQCCGINAYTRDGKLIKVTGMEEHPFNHLCVKAQGIMDWLYSPQRVTSPMKRNGNSWQKISWDEAFDIIADKLAKVKEKYGAKSLVIHLGNPFIGTHVGRVASRFCSLYGSPNYTSTASLCWAAGGIGHGLTISDRLLRLCPSYEGTRCIAVWGLNPQQSNIVEAAQIAGARKKGAKLIVVDPRHTPLAKEADIYAQIRPGTDAVLALGVINVIIAERLYDRAFVEKWTSGFDKLAAYAQKFSPEEVEKLTWVPAKTVRDIARMYARAKPAAITQGVPIDHSLSGVQTSRALSILMTITGNLDVAGGNVYNPPLRLTSFRVKGAASSEEGIGAGYPIFARFTGEQTSAPVPDAILSGEPYPVKAVIVHGSNPMMTWPDTSKVKQAFSELDLLVVSDLFMTETAKLADIFLPTTTIWEGEALKDYAFVGMPLVILAHKVVEPLGECQENWQIWAELGKRMGYAEYFPWQSTDELLANLLEPSGYTLNQLKTTLGGIVYGNPIGGQKYLEKGLSSPSGKVELYSQLMEKYGYEPLPAFIEPLKGDGQAKDYPLILISGTRVHAFTHSRHRNVARLKKLIPYPTVEINTATARKLGISDGDEVTVESPQGSISLKARLSDDIHPRVISITHGWEEANVNLLTDGDARDPVSGYPAFKSVMCRVQKT